MPRNHPVTRDEVYISRVRLSRERTRQGWITTYGPAIVALPLDACVPKTDGRWWSDYSEYDPHEPVEGLFDMTALSVKRWEWESPTEGWFQKVETPELCGTYYAGRDWERHHCVHCTRAFATCDRWSRIKYCSNRCAYQARDKAIVARVVAKRSAARAEARADRQCAYAPCDNLIDAERSTRRFCSDRCRVAHHRAVTAKAE
jgi:hypothetical protein